LLGETLDDAAGEAFDKTAQLLGLGYPGGPAISKLAETGDAYRFKLPRPMLNSGDLDFSFAGLKTAVLTLVKREGPAQAADIAAAFQLAAVEVLAAKSIAAVRQSGLKRLVVAGGVGANKQLRERLNAEAAQRHFEVFYPPLDLCTDNGAMIAYAGALRMADAQPGDGRFTIRPRWDLGELAAP
ncbi:MAG: tRNA (adenosine(37)-N6)-threonylcarbamoyltransferase complex transferase subunit TsaD, partial [Thiobacillus sp.]|nr:tRNA (adenosine(37)-N6)-threonylcarbamoyltransferase complex transferase subunit TsaD [Thiobacillus sp.]